MPVCVVLHGMQIAKVKQGREAEAHTARDRQGNSTQPNSTQQHTLQCFGKHSNS